MTESKRAILAAMLAVTHLRFPMPAAHKIAHLKQNADPNMAAHDAVISLAAEHMENEDHEEIFRDEASVMARELRDMTAELIAQTFPDHHRAYEEAA